MEEDEYLSAIDNLKRQATADLERLCDELDTKTFIEFFLSGFNCGEKEDE